MDIIPQEVYKQLSWSTQKALIEQQCDNCLNQDCSCRSCLGTKIPKWCPARQNPHECESHKKIKCRGYM